MTYYSTAGRDNLDKTLALAKKAAEDLGIESIVIASTTGFTAKRAVEAFGGTRAKLTFVGTVRDKFPSELIAELKEKGCNVCFSHEIKYYYPEIVANAYRRFCQGVKVAVEIAMIAVREGYLTSDRDVISVGKWDTALIVNFPTLYSSRSVFEDLQIRELICKPR